MRNLLWAIPLFPLAGFLVNGLVYLLSHRTKGEAHGHGNGEGSDAHTAATAPDAGHASGHDAGHHEIPFKGLHTIVGVGSVAMACVLAFGAIFDIGLKAFSEGAAHSLTLWRWIPLGVNQAVGQMEEFVARRHTHQRRTRLTERGVGVPDESPVVYAPQGYLVFVRNDALVAQAFDAAKLALAGDAMPIMTGQANELGTRRFTVSDNGVLIWQGKWQRDYQLVWFDREGKHTGTVDAPMKVAIGQDPHISPDGKRLVVKRDFNLWVIDLEKGTGLRITSTFSQIPAWSEDRDGFNL